MGFYNEKHIGTRAKSSKTCSWCGGNIPKGEPHYVLTCMESYCSYPIHEHCHTEASRECKDDMDEFLSKTQY